MEGTAAVTGLVAGAAAPAAGVPWWAEMMVSPVVAAVAAVLVALLGLRAAGQRLRTERALAAAADRRGAAAAVLARAGTVEDRDRAQWWATYRWVVEDLVPVDPAGAHGVLRVLERVTDDPVSRALVEVALRPGVHGGEEPL